MTPEIIDAVRFGHLLFVTLGLGAAFLADIQVVVNLRRPVSRQLIGQLRLYHCIVWGGLLGMWITGLVLVYIRTGLDPALFTPKLLSKLAIVSVLTFNALLIGRFALPLLRSCIGRRPTQLLLRRQVFGGWLASISSASWLLALALGASKVLATSNWVVFALIVPGVYATLLLGSTCVVLTLHILSRREAQMLTPDPQWQHEINELLDRAEAAT